MNSPYILEETGDYAVVFKPPKMHSRENGTRNGEKETLLGWYAAQKAPQKAPQSAHVYDIMHRLDYETHGLVLVSKNEKSFHFFKDQQDKGEFVKEYSAICINSIENADNFHSDTDKTHSSVSDYLPGFPPCARGNDNLIKSWFRPYGPGRKQVRPVIEDAKKHREIAKDKGFFYVTEIVSADKNVFTVRIKRGFRHQIRCHLYWIGFPILNDPLYSPPGTLPSRALTEQTLALRAHAVFFTDPAQGIRHECRIAALDSKHIFS